MKNSISVLVALYAAHAAAHGVVTQIKGANGVVMPGLSVVDGVPRDCASPFCGSEEDTSIIRDDELGTDEASALGRNSNGPIDPNDNVSQFMGSSANKTKVKTKRGFLDGLFGGDDSDSEDSSDSSSAAESEGVATPEGTTEDIVAKTAGNGASSGLPTCSDDGTVTMTYHQVNQDGAGPLNAQVDATSGGTDPEAFQDAEVTQDVPGAVLGLSGTTTTDFPIAVKMPAGMTCKGQIGDVKNVCVVRVRNDAIAGPFGGSAAFTMSNAAKKRAIAFKVKSKRFSRGMMSDLE